MFKRIIKKLINKLSNTKTVEDIPTLTITPISTVNKEIKTNKVVKNNINTESERWVPVKVDIDYTGIYEVSTMGRVRSLDRVISSSFSASRKIHGRILKQFKYSGGWRLTLAKDGKKNLYQVSRLVWESFNLTPLTVNVSFKDGNNDNNSLLNLVNRSKH